MQVLAAAAHSWASPVLSTPMARLWHSSQPCGCQYLPKLSWWCTEQLEADTIALAAGAVTAMLAANAAAVGSLDSPEKVL